MSRPYLARVGQCQQPLAQRVKDAARTVLLVDGQVRACDVADEERVASQDRPRFGTARHVDQGEGGVLGSVPGGVDRAYGDAAEFELPAIVERLVIVFRARFLMDVNRGARRDGQAPMPGDVVGMVMRLEDVLDVNARVASEAQVLVDLETRVHHGGHTSVLISDEVGGAAEVVVSDLPKEHYAASAGSTPSSSAMRRRSPPQTCSQSSNTDSSTIEYTAWLPRFSRADDACLEQDAQVLGDVLLGRSQRVAQFAHGRRDPPAGDRAA